MQVGAEVRLFNWKMRKRRRELGLTQADLAELAGTNVNNVGLVERLQHVPSNFLGTNRVLIGIAKALDMEFDDLFPPEYLDAVKKKILPRGARRILWVREVSLEALPEPEIECDLLLTSGEEMDRGIYQEQLAGTIEGLLGELPGRQRKVLEMRYGLDGSVPRTFAEIANELGVGIVRARQIESQAMTRLRHPVHNRKLRKYL
jgi:transcriptional regulator with XRE-family HTH domain